MADECHGALDLPTESLDFTHGFSWTLQAKFKCLCCGHTDNADHVAALNILARGLT